MKRVPDVYQECRTAEESFGRDPGDAVQAFGTEDAELILVAGGTMATTARSRQRRRDAGEKIGLVKLKMYRPFPRVNCVRLARPRAGSGARSQLRRHRRIFWQDTCAAFPGHRDDLLIQTIHRSVRR